MTDRMRLRWHLISAQEEMTKLVTRQAMGAELNELRAQCELLDAEMRQVERTLNVDGAGL